MAKIVLSPGLHFSLDLTLGCGQVFRWEKRGRWWQGIVGEECIRLRQSSRTLELHGTTKETIRDYFQLDLDLEKIAASIDKDPVIHGALCRCRGLRIIHQPAWECLASYICATYSNIPGIKKKIACLSTTFGKPILTDQGLFHCFPTPEVLASSDLSRGRTCSLGYRAPYLYKTARLLAEDPGWSTRIDKLSYRDARRFLLGLMGVGPKVADCVLLFAFGKYDAFPVDVWISRIMQQYYTGEGPAGYQYIAETGRSYFGSYAGYAQEYLYCDRGYLTGRKEKIG